MSEASEITSESRSHLFVQRLGVSLDEMPPETLRGMADEVCFRHGISLAALRGPGRRRNVAWPRQEFIWMARKTGRFTTTQIGRFLGDRDHTTVIYGARRHAERAKASKAKQ